MIQTSLRTPLKLHTPTFLACAAFSLLPLLPSRASVLSLFAGFRLLSSPCALVSVGPLCPPCCSWSWLVLVAPSPLWVWFVLRPCFGWSALPALLFVVLVGAGGSLSFVGLVCFAGVACFLFGLFVWCFFVVCLWLVFRFRVVLLLFPPLSFFSGPFVCFAPTCATKVLVYHCTCVSDRRLDRFTCTVYLHRVTMFLLQCSCVTICRVLR